MNKYLLGGVAAVCVIAAGSTVAAVRHQYGQPLLPHLVDRSTPTPSMVPLVTPTPVVIIPATTVPTAVSATVLPVMTVAKIVVTQKPEQRTDMIQLQTTNSGPTALSAQVVVTFYNAAGHPIGSASTITTPIPANGTQASTFYTSDLIDSYASVKAFASVAQ